MKRCKKCKSTNIEFVLDEKGKKIRCRDCGHEF